MATVRKWRSMFKNEQRPRIVIAFKRPVLLAKHLGYGHVPSDGFLSANAWITVIDGKALRAELYCVVPPRPDLELARPMARPVARATKETGADSLRWRLSYFPVRCPALPRRCCPS